MPCVLASKNLLLLWFIFTLSSVYRASLVAHMVKNLPVAPETWVQSLSREDPLGKGIGYPLQYSCLENSMDRGVWQAAVHGVEKRHD